MKPTKKKVFLDSSVLVAGCASLTGASAFILGTCRLKKIQGYLSLDVIGETRKNVNLKLDSSAKKRFLAYLKRANLMLAPLPSAEGIAQCEEYINQKDAPILASALKSPADFLITLDKKHFLTPQVVKFAKPLRVISPREFVLKYLKS